MEHRLHGHALMVQSISRHQHWRLMTGQYTLNHYMLRTKVLVSSSLLGNR